jgi:hypothetical protein
MDVEADLKLNPRLEESRPREIRVIHGPRSNAPMTSGGPLITPILPTSEAINLTSAFDSWASLLRENGLQLVKLGVVNVFITFASEAFFRELVYRHISPSSKISLLGLHSGTYILNKQVFISCSMSFFASIFGGIVYFLMHRKNRWFYFVGFGIVNCAFCQALGSVLLPYSTEGFFQRIVFDSVYSATLRFGSFELFRRPILNTSFRLIPLFGWRLAQDFLLSAFRIGAIIFLGLSTQ